MAKATARAGTTAGLGGFGALFDLKQTKYVDPLLVSTTDGVGTKLRVAIESGKHDTVGIDLVAMCVNDLIVQGAEPLFFLDYFATGKLAVESAQQVIAGIAEGCRQAGCALVGGETAEMPGMYAKGDYDLAGFAVGAVERTRVLPRADLEVGDIVIGLASSGVHSNGFSLVRRVVEQAGLSYTDAAPFETAKSLGEALLVPTRIYVKPLLDLLPMDHIKAMAHITGGGLLENIPRVLPEGLGVWLNTETWPVPPVFKWLAQQGGIDAHEMARTFNCGIGMVLVAPQAAADIVMGLLKDSGEQAYRIGEVEATKATRRVTLQGLGTYWPC